MNQKDKQRTNLKFENTDFRQLVSSFIISRKAAGLAKKTIEYYTEHLARFEKFADARKVITLEDITPDEIRRFMIELKEDGRNPGGQSCAYRALRCFLLWVENEYEPENWRSPTHRTHGPKVSKNPKPGVTNETVSALLEVCEISRDRAIVLLLFDSGVRREEAHALKIKDFNPIEGRLFVQHGKGDKSRPVFLGKKAGKALRAYLKERGEDDPEAALIATIGNKPLSYGGWREVTRRLSVKAGIKEPGLHDFRRGFATNFLKAGGNVFELQDLMGHEDIATTRRYVKFVESDLQEAHRRASPADRLK